MLDALTKKLEGEIAVAKANVDIYLSNAAGIGEHSDILEAIQAEMDKIAVHQDRLDIIKKYLEV